MTSQVGTGTVNHVTLTVSNVERAREFYTDLLGFQVVTQFGARLLLSNGSVIFALGTAPDPSRGISGDRFDENRIGLDHISLSVKSRAELEQAKKVFEERGVSHGEIKDLEALGIYVLAFRDPDNIQLELTAPHG